MSKRIIVVGYSYPNDPAWESVFAHADDVFAVILNPASGIGDAPDANYKAIVDRLRDAGCAPMGYVSTRYGARPIDEIKAEIARWFAWYGVSGIFADEQSTDPNYLAYYRRIKGAVGTGLLATNPGTVPDKAYLDLDAILCIVETDQQAYLGKSFPDWVRNAPKSRFYHIVYGVSDVEKVVAKVNANNAEFFSVVSVPGPDPQFSVETLLWPNLTPTPPAPVEDPNWAAINLRLVAVALQAPANSTLADVPNLAAQRMLELVQLRAQSATVRLSAVPADQLLDEIRRRLAT